MAFVVNFSRLAARRSRQDPEEPSDSFRALAFFRMLFLSGPDAGHAQVDADRGGRQSDSILCVVELRKLRIRRSGVFSE